MQPHQKRGLAIAAAGLVAMLIGGFATADFRYRIAPSRFLVEPMNIATTADEAHIVVGSMYAKLHVLGPDGRPEASWRLPTEPGPFRLAITADDRIRVATREPARLFEYDLAGELLGEEEDPDAYDRIGPEHEAGFTSDSGTQYLIEDGRIVRADSDGESVLVEGFESHEAITLRMIGMGLLLFVGVLMLVAGVVATGRPRRRG